MSILISNSDTRGALALSPFNSKSISVLDVYELLAAVNRKSLCEVFAQQRRVL